MQTTLFALFATPRDARQALDALGDAPVAEDRWTARLRIHDGARRFLRLVETDLRRGLSSGVLMGGLVGALVGSVMATFTATAPLAAVGFCTLAGFTYGALGSALISLALPHHKLSDWQRDSNEGTATLVITADDAQVRRRVEEALDPYAMELAHPEHA